MSQRDRRQEILTEIYSVLSGLTITLTGGKTIPAGNIVRNRNELPAEMVPGLILCDADEVRDPRLERYDGRNLPVRPTVMKMTPEIYVVLDVRKPQNESVGEDLNLARNAILNAVLKDEKLHEICSSNGDLCYDGVITDLARNRMMQGQMGISITFAYHFDPRELG